MTTMLEKMGDRIAAAFSAQGGSAALDTDWTEVARAALQAIREPSEVMLEAADDGVSYYPRHIEAAWPDAIDAILEGKA